MRKENKKLGLPLEGWNFGIFVVMYMHEQQMILESFLELKLDLSFFLWKEE